MMGTREDDVNHLVSTIGLDGIFNNWLVLKKGLMPSFSCLDYQSAHGQLLGPPTLTPVTGVVMAAALLRLRAPAVEPCCTFRSAPCCTLLRQQQQRQNPVHFSLQLPLCCP
jgi:hypothetical protein